MKNYCNQQSGPCRFTVCQSILFFLLQLTRTLTVNNDNDSAMTHVILETHFCHATVHYEMMSFMEIILISYSFPL